MNKRIVFAITLFLLPALTLVAQEYRESSQPIIERIAESYAENFSEETDLSPILEDLERYLENPLNINNASRQDLERLHFLNSFQIENLLAYRRKVGQIYSQFELETIEGFSGQLAADLTAFVAFMAPDEKPKAYYKQELNLRYGQALEKAAGFIEKENGEKAFAGSPARMLLKYRAEKGDQLKWGLTAENDAGEEFFKGSNPYGFDFYSGYFGYKGNKILKEVIVGDYQVKTGQGLIQWSGYGKRKSSDGVSVRATGQGLRANTSTDENNFMRGAATRFELGNFDLITFYSNSNVDATITETDVDGNPTRVSSLQVIGYHRTASEIKNKNSLNVQTAGATVKYTINRFSVGLNSAWQKFGAPLEPAYQPYNHHYFRGDENFNIGTDLLWVFNRINFFGEAAISKSGGTAVLAGFESQPLSELAISMVVRDFAPDFHTISGTSFSESDGNRNERGIYAGLSIFPMANIKLSGYIDAYESHWIRYTSSGPVKGTDLILQTDYTPRRNLSMYVRIKSENNSEKSSTDDPIANDENKQTTRARYNINWTLNDQLTLRFRTEWSGYKKEEHFESGWMVFTDVVTKPFNKLSATARFAWFNTESYNSRVYAYENDVPQYFYIPAFYSQGLRYYLNFNYELLQNLKLYVKLSQTRYFDEDFTMGSGNTLVEGNRRTDMRIQLRYRF